MSAGLTRRQREIHRYLLDHEKAFSHPPTLDELCEAMGVASRGSMHKHIQSLVAAGLVEPMNGRQRGVRLIRPQGVPFLGYIAAGRPIEALADPEPFDLPAPLKSAHPCYVLRVKGDSMIEDGIFDGDWVVVESRDHARNGEVVVALIDGREATLKRIEQRGGRVVLHPANSAMQPMVFESRRVVVQGVLVGLVRRY
jgi:repressor LexA